MRTINFTLFENKSELETMANSENAQDGVLLFSVGESEPLFGVKVNAKNKGNLALAVPSGIDEAIIIYEQHPFSISIHNGALYLGEISSSFIGKSDSVAYTGTRRRMEELGIWQ